MAAKFHLRHQKLSARTISPCLIRKLAQGPSKWHYRHAEMWMHQYLIHKRNMIKKAKTIDGSLTPSLPSETSLSEPFLPSDKEISSRPVRVVSLTAETLEPQDWVWPVYRGSRLSTGVVDKCVCLYKYSRNNDIGITEGDAKQISNKNRKMTPGGHIV